MLAAPNLNQTPAEMEMAQQLDLYTQKLNLIYPDDSAALLESFYKHFNEWISKAGANTERDTLRYLVYLKIAVSLLESLEQLQISLEVAKPNQELIRAIYQSSLEFTKLVLHADFRKCTLHCPANIRLLLEAVVAANAFYADQESIPAINRLIVAANEINDASNPVLARDILTSSILLIPVTFYLYFASSPFALGLSSIMATVSLAAKYQENKRLFKSDNSLDKNLTLFVDEFAAPATRWCNFWQQNPRVQNQNHFVLPLLADQAPPTPRR